jgi:hypothetical protein
MGLLKGEEAAQLSESDSTLTGTRQAKQVSDRKEAEFETALSTAEFLLELPMEGVFEEPISLIENAHRSASCRSLFNRSSSSVPCGEEDRRTALASREDTISFRVKRSLSSRNQHSSCRSFEEKMHLSSSDRLQMSLRDLMPATDEENEIAGVQENSNHAPLDRRAMMAIFHRGGNRGASNIASQRSLSASFSDLEESIPKRILVPRSKSNRRGRRTGRRDGAERLHKSTGCLNYEE